VRDGDGSTAAIRSLSYTFHNLNIILPVATCYLPSLLYHVLSRTLPLWHGRHSRSRHNVRFDRSELVLRVCNERLEKDVRGRPLAGRPAAYMRSMARLRAVPFFAGRTAGMDAFCSPVYYLCFF